MYPATPAKIDLCILQVARKAASEAVGPSAARELRELQELESRVLMYDLLAHGDRSARGEFHIKNGNVPEDHWFHPIRRLVSGFTPNALFRAYKHEFYLDFEYRAERHVWEEDTQVA